MQALSIFRILYMKELKESFKTPMVYILTGLFCFLMGGLFYNYVVGSQELTKGNLSLNVLVPLFGNMNFIFLFLAPLLTMRSYIDEKKNSTIDLLMMSPAGDYSILLSKFFCSLTVAAFMLAPTFIFPIILSTSGYDDWGVVFSSYLGIIMSVGCYLSVGLMASTLTNNQIVSAISAFVILLGFMLLVVVGRVSNNFLVSQMVNYMSVPYHYEGFARGVIRSYDMVFYFSFSGIFLYLSHKIVASRNL